MKAIQLLMMGVACWTGVVACAGAGESESAGTDQALVKEDPDSTYFTLRPDLRKCASPRCGGFFVAAVNRTATRCADGTAQASCYVADLDLGALGLSEEQASELRAQSTEFLLRGSIVPRTFTGTTLGQFQATEAWHGHAGITPSGTFLRTKNSGIVCITFPCPTLTARALNLNNPAFSAASLDLSDISKDPSDGFAQLGEPEGLLVAAKRTVVSGPAGEAVGLDASEYYLPFESKVALCGSRGLPECAKGSYCDFPPSANCGRADAPGVCKPQPVACTKQFDPVCGCDGQTYGNACAAASAGVSVEHKGACEEAPRVCGTIVGLSCEPGEFCDFGVGQCRVSDAGGVCRPQPQVCTEIFDPVCGCDGKTYSNTCFAQAAGAQIDHAGACK